VLKAHRHTENSVCPVYFPQKEKAVNRGLQQLHHRNSQEYDKIVEKCVSVSTWKQLKTCTITGGGETQIYWQQWQQSDNH
jgi:hypothetical protein